MYWKLSLVILSRIQLIFRQKKNRLQNAHPKNWSLGQRKQKAKSIWLSTKILYWKRKNNSNQLLYEKYSIWYMLLVKFIYSEKATKFCKIPTLLLSYVVPVKSKVEISQNCMAFSEYMNFNFVIYYSRNDPTFSM